MTIAALKTYVQQYRGEDGQERVVMLTKHYEELLGMVEAHEGKGEWEVGPYSGYVITVKRRSIYGAPILVMGDAALAQRIARLLNESERG